MTVSIASTEIIGPEFTPQEPPERPESNDPFFINGDGSIDLDISGKLDVTKSAKFDDNVTIDGTLIVQEVDILQEIEDLNASIGQLQGDVQAILLSLQS
jgi:hypothetical protein